MLDLRSYVVLKIIYPLWCFLLLSFHLQITYRQMRNLQIGVDKLIEKVSINLLHHAKSAACIISIIIINVPAVAYLHS